MNINQCSEQLRVLAKQHANYQMVFTEYRQNRKQLLDSLDQSYNGIEPVQPIPVEQAPVVENSTINDVDKTQPYLAKKIGKCLNYLKKS